MFHIDLDPNSSQDGGVNAEVVSLLQQLVEGQQKQNAILAQMAEQLENTQKQRAQEFERWRRANPKLAQRCHDAATTLNQVQSEFIEALTEEVNENEEALLDGGFMMHEFVDRFGPRLIHLNSVLQVLSQLGHTSANTQPQT